MNHLEDRWKKLSLTEEENRGITVDEEKLLEESKKGECSLVGKLHVEIIINNEVLSTTMAKI